MMSVNYMSKEVMDTLVMAGQMKILTYIISGGDKSYQVEKDGRKMLIKDRETAESAPVKYASVSVGGGHFGARLY